MSLSKAKRDYKIAIGGERENAYKALVAEVKAELKKELGITPKIIVTNNQFGSL